MPSFLGHRHKLANDALQIAGHQVVAGLRQCLYHLAEKDNNASVTKRTFCPVLQYVHVLECADVQCYSHDMHP